jgi:beta-N-acetylhexosaminidase
MNKFILSVLSMALICSCQAQVAEKTAQTSESFTLQDYYKTSKTLDAQVDAVFEKLSDEQRVAQMIIASLGKLGKPYAAVDPLIKKKQIGGIIFLSGDTKIFENKIDSINAMHTDWPMLMSMDAEPSLFNRRMPGTPQMSNTADLKTSIQVEEAVSIIDKTLKKVGFQQNFAPVLDLSANNEAIGNRTFGSDSATVVPMAQAFINATQKDQVIATAKHFPGHGRVSGDTHKKLVFIDGEMTEVGLYKPIIEAGVLSIMVGHIAIENNEKYSTNGMPSTLSKPIVTDLLRNEMNFKGLIITDAMNMGAVNAIPNCGVKAAEAGCDMILMPVDELGTLNGILTEMNENEAFRNQIYDSVKRIIRAKICLGMQF